MKMELQEVKDNRTSEAKAFEAGWIAQFHNLKAYLPEAEEYLSGEWFDYQYDLMCSAFTDFKTDEQIQEQTSGEVSIEPGGDGGRSAGV